MSGHLTHCGFVWRALAVTRLTEGKRGDVLLELKTPKVTIDVRVTKSGIVQFFDSEGEQLSLVPTTKVTA